MKATTKLIVLERAHTLLMIAAGVATACVVMWLIPSVSGDGITLRDLAELAAALLAAYPVTFLADQIIAAATNSLRDRLQRDADRPALPAPSTD